MCFQDAEQIFKLSIRSFQFNFCLIFPYLVINTFINFCATLLYIFLSTEDLVWRQIFRCFPFKDSNSLIFLGKPFPFIINLISGVLAHTNCSLVFIKNERLISYSRSIPKLCQIVFFWSNLVNFLFVWLYHSRYHASIIFE